MMRTLVFGAALVGAAAAGAYRIAGVQAQQPAKPAALAGRTAGLVPQFSYDKTWPKPLPNRMKVGQVVGVSVDSHDHIWILQRPTSLKPSEIEATEAGAYGGQRGPNSGCCRPAPPIIEFDQQGNMVQTWGSQPGMDWPTPGPKSKDNALGTAPFGERGLYVDFKDNVWLGADGPGDAFMMKLSKFGKPYVEVGKKGKPSGGSNDTASVNGAAGFVVDADTNEVYVADGLRNRRVIVFDWYSGTYKRHWGAYGKKPDDSVPTKVNSPDVDSPQFGDVACIALSHDKQIYVCDRTNNRIQVFKTDGTYVKQGTVSPKTLAGTTWGVSFSADPEQKYMYVANGGDNKIEILDRASLQTLGSFGSGGHYAGMFTTPAAIATDSKGNLYVGETWEGKRVQRFTYKGLGPAK